MVGLLAFMVVEFVQAAAGPEMILEGVGIAVGAADRRDLLEDDRPDPDACQQQAQDHQLDDDIRLQEQAPERKAAPGRRQLRGINRLIQISKPLLLIGQGRVGGPIPSISHSR